MKPSDSAKSTPGASASCDTTGQMSLFGETCGSSRVLTLDGLFTTPTSDVSMRQKRYAQGGTALGMQVSASSPQGIPASHSHSPGSDWARRMTATYGRKFGDWYLSSGPPDSWVRTLLGTSIWGSMTCYLTWKKSVTPAGRLLFRLVPSTPRTAGIGSGSWLATEVMEIYPTPNAINRPHDGHRQTWTRLAVIGQIPDALATAAHNGKLNSAWVSRMMGYPDGWLDSIPDGEVIP